MSSTRFRIVASHAALIIGTALMILPVYMAFVASTHDLSRSLTGLPLWPGAHLIDNYGQVLGEGMRSYGLPPIGPMLFNSFVVALAITFGKIAVSILSGFAITYFQFPFRILAFWIIFATMMLPVEVRILPTYEVVAGFGMLDSYTGLSLPLIASATATFLFRQVFMTVPDELTEAARIDGAGPWRFLWWILIPMSRTNIAALFVITFIYGWNQYLWPLLMTKDVSYYTVIMGIQRMARASDFQPQWHLVMATVILALLPPVIVVAAMQKQFVKGLFETEK
ncbi:sn-glycerol-3-phosphate ABC transporter permease UgpE [Bosea sp. 2KB_26]|uniref:sn-glycerol-3-phosphate ABC transporter permease UgpE n=1 Tax=Bosea sp. 2KB_26 TaxID=3237475 RepID=UPI000DE571B2